MPKIHTDPKNKADGATEKAGNLCANYVQSAGCTPMANPLLCVELASDVPSAHH